MTMLRESVGGLVVVRCWCGIQHAVPESLRRMQVKAFNDGKRPRSIYCPLGHQWVPSGEPEAKRLERRLAAERAEHDQTKAELRTTEYRRRAEKAARTKLAKRIHNGVCPCCKRTFQNLARHMASQHPDWCQDENERAD